MTFKMPKGWKAVIGLEIHVELNTKSKLFSSAVNAFGCEPNTNLDVVSTGMPGSLPVLNKEAVNKAIALGLAIGGHINLYSRFDRKSYFYPDCPRNYQITQFDIPIIEGGQVTAEVNDEDKTFQIERVQIEDDAGNLRHFNDFAAVDFNRAGVPLLEIVSAPCIHSPEEAVAYAMELKAILQYINASDCNMEEGSMRMDVNVSVRKESEVGFRNRSEIKNMNSFTNMALAIEYELKRQVELYESNPDQDPAALQPQGTYRFDLETMRTVRMRLKESADDYRYFPEPDLGPCIIEKEQVEEIRQNLPELPYERLKRYIEQYQFDKKIAFQLTCDKQLADYFENTLEVSKDPKQTLNWLLTEFAGRLKASGKMIYQTVIAPRSVGVLIDWINTKKITGKIAKSIADILVDNQELTPEKILEQNPDFVPLNDTDEIQAIVDEVVAANPQSIIDFNNGKDRALGFLVGQVMKKTKGKADPTIVNKLIKEAL